MSSILNKIYKYLGWRGINFISTIKPWHGGVRLQMLFIDINKSFVILIKRMICICTFSYNNGLKCVVWKEQTRRSKLTISNILWGEKQDWNLAKRVSWLSLLLLWREETSFLWESDRNQWLEYGAIQWGWAELKPTMTLYFIWSEVRADSPFRVGEAGPGGLSLLGPRLGRWWSGDSRPHQSLSVRTSSQFIPRHHTHNCNN